MCHVLNAIMASRNGKRSLRICMDTHSQANEQTLGYKEDETQESSLVKFQAYTFFKNKVVPTGEVYMYTKAQLDAHMKSHM